MPRAISLVLVVPAERVAHSVRGFYDVVAVDVDGLGRGGRHGGRHQTPEREIERRNHLKVKTIPVLKFSLHLSRSFLLKPAIFFHSAE